MTMGSLSLETRVLDIFKELFPDEPWDNEDLQDTPKRWIAMMKEFTTPEDFSITTFDNTGCDEMVVVQNISFISLCAHHLAPFTGVAHVAYVPKDTIVGLSKIPRLVRFHAAGLWTQEELTQHLANDFETQLEPVGVAVVMRAEHQCMSLRGVKATGSITTTSAMKGCFADHSKQARAEFLSLIAR